MEERDETNIIIPRQMPVSELRKWLVQFAEGNREHYEKNMIQKSAHGPSSSLYHTGYDEEPKYQTLDHIPSSTSSTASSSHGTLGGIRTRSSIDEFSVQRGEKEVGQPRSSDEFDYSGEEDGRRYSQDDSIFESLATSQDTVGLDPSRGPDVFAGSKSHAPVPRQDVKQDEEYRIVSIHKLLEVPKPSSRQDPATSWDEFLDDDFSDPYSASSHPTSFVWHSNHHTKNHESLSEKTITRAPDEVDSSSSTHDESISTSSVLAGCRKKISSDDETDSLSTWSRSSTRSLRNRLPKLLCKSAKEENTMLVQKTYHNGPAATHPERIQSAFRPLSPHPLYYKSESYIRSHPATNASHCDSGDDIVPSQVGNDDDASKSIMSCPDFATATAYLQKFSQSNEAAQERALRRESRLQRFPRKTNEYGTSAILPGAVDSALGQVFLVDKDENKGKEAMLKDDYNARPSSSLSRNRNVSSEFESTSRVSDAVSRFGGQMRRASTSSTVQLRRKELEQQWATKRSVQHVKKVKWQVCNTTGNYKKKIIVDPESCE